MMKYKTSDSNLGSQCAAHHKSEWFPACFYFGRLEKEIGSQGTARSARFEQTEQRPGQARLVSRSCAASVHVWYWQYEIGEFVCRGRRRNVDGAVVMVGTRVLHRMKGREEMKGCKALVI